jgi:hypothetical protein
LASVAIATTVAAVTAVATVATVAITASAAVAISITVAVWWWTLLKRLVISLHLLKQLSAKLLGFSYAFWSGSRDVKVHGLITFLARLRLHETRSAALDLDLAAGLLLNILDIVATTTYDLRTKIEATDGFKTNRELLLGPFATTKLVTFKVFGFATTETALVNQVGQFLCQHLFDHLDSLVESFLGRASNAEIQRRVSCGCHALVWIVFSSSSNILRMYKQSIPT